MSTKTSISRRQFLAQSGMSGLGLALHGLTPLMLPCAMANPTDLPPTPSYTDWHDIYRDQWAWDKVVKSSHFTNCWYQSHCAWNVYIKDGVVWREEQVGNYPQTNPDVPDFNPRGCQKGACFSERMYDPGRVKYPLKRVGERGSGKWQRVSWDEALDDLAEEFIRTVTEEGPDRVIWDNGPLFTFGAMALAQTRFSSIAGTIALDMNSEIGDAHRGAAETFGKIVFERSADDYFNSDLILIWGCNPFATQIPNAHFLVEARYNGATLVTIAPDYSPSSIHSDLWIPVKPGTDAALALAMAKIIIDENKYDVAFIKEQTDLPLLVREDTGLFLRQSDLQADGDEEILYWFDANAGAIAEVERTTLALGSVDPALEGSFEANTLEGPVRVRPVFEKLKERLADYDVESASEICGTPPEMIRDFAQRFASAKAASLVTSSNFSKYYHGNLIERSQALLFSLCGQMGRKGSGFVAFPFLTNDGFDMLAVMPTDPAKATNMAFAMGRQMREFRERGYTDEMITYEMLRQTVPEGRGVVCGVLFWAIHGGLLEHSGRSAEWDPYMKRPLSEYLDESLDKGWQHVWPKRGNDPRMMFSFGSNILRRLRSYPLLLKTLWPKLRKIAVLDFRMTSTGMFADYVLPVSAWYERDDHKWGTMLMPFLHAGEKAVQTGEAWHEWRIITVFAKKIGELAAAKGLDIYKDALGEEHSLQNLYSELTYAGKYDENSESDVAGEIVRRSSNLAENDWKKLQKTGFTRFTGIGRSPLNVGNATEFKENETIAPLTEHVQGKVPYPTLSRRIQFYIDHPFYMELDEFLPRHKDSPKAGGDYPLQLTGGHTRWSIHSQWRDDALMLQQQRGVPVMYMSDADAEARGISDGEDARVLNDLDSFIIHVKVSPAVRAGQLIIYHAWENFQFVEGKGFQNLIPSPINPVELSGGQFHLRPMPICLQPGQFDRDTRVEVERV